MLENVDYDNILVAVEQYSHIFYLYEAKEEKDSKKRAKWKKENIKIQSSPIMFLFLNYLQFFYFYI